MVLGELGRGPMILEMKIPMLKYWNKSLDPFRSKWNCKLYKFLYHFHHVGHFSSPWLLYIEKLLNDTGFCNTWIRQEMSESTWINVNIKQILLDQYIQKWRSDVDIGVKCFNYRLFKSDFSWNKLPESIKNASTLLGFKKSLTTYFNDILESNFNVNDTCTWVHVCKCALCRQCS